jgi:hypothetical protein
VAFICLLTAFVWVLHAVHVFLLAFLRLANRADPMAVFGADGFWCGLPVKRGERIWWRHILNREP